jgi:hypothetical protein
MSDNDLKVAQMEQEIILMEKLTRSIFNQTKRQYMEDLYHRTSAIKKRKFPDRPVGTLEEFMELYCPWTVDDINNDITPTITEKVEPMSFEEHLAKYY